MIRLKLIMKYNLTKPEAECLVNARQRSIKDLQRGIQFDLDELAKIEAELLDPKRNKAQDKNRRGWKKLGKEAIQVKKRQIAFARETLQEWASDPEISDTLAIAATAALL